MKHMMKQGFALLLALAIGLPAAAQVVNPQFIQSGAGAVSRSFLEKAREEISVNDFGAKANGIADDTAAIHAALNAAPVGAVVRFVGKYRTTAKITIAKQGIKLVGGSNYLNSEKSVIQLDAAASDAQVLDLQTDGVSFENLTIRGKGKAVAGSHIFTTARTDNVADIDATFTRCTLSDAETIGTLTGRGLLIDGSTIVNFVQGVYLNWPSTLADGANTDQKLNTGFRAIRFNNNRVHAGSGGYLFWNTYTNNEKILGVQVTGNHIDTNVGLWRGTLQNALITGNKHYNNSTSPFLVQAGFYIKDATISGNEFNGMPDDGAGNTKQYANWMYADLVNNLTVSSNVVKRVRDDAILIVSAASRNIAITNNVFADALLNHRNPSARYILKISTVSTQGITFSQNVIETSVAADTARIFGDVLVHAPGTAGVVLSGNQYPDAWKLANVTPNANKRADIAAQVYDGDGAAEQVIDLEFYPSAVIVNALTGAAAGSTRLQLYGTSTGSTEVDLRNGSVAVKGNFNLAGARYTLIALP